MPFIRVLHNKNYTCINNTIATDKRLSWKAKGIFLYAFSRPDDWQFHIDDLINQSIDGRDAVRAGIRELVDAGYLVKTQLRNADGSFSKEVEWIFHEIPQKLKESLPKTENPSTENPKTENHPLLSTEEELSTEKEQQQQPQKNQSAAVFSCLLDVPIPDDDKRWLTKHHTETDVVTAIAWATHPMTKIETTLQQAIKWACKTKPKIPVLAVDQEEANRKWATAIEKHLITPPYTHFTVLTKSMEISYDTNKAPDVVDFTAKGFKDQAVSLLTKAGFRFNKDV
jgi:hypothetical protein